MLIFPWIFYFSYKKFVYVIKSDFSILDVDTADSCRAKSSIKVTDNEAKGFAFDFLCGGESVIMLIC